jgi:hypothetical protein
METTMATSAERMRALRERQRRGLGRLTIDVSEDDLRAIAKRGYEGAVTTDLDQQAQAVGLFLTKTAPADFRPNDSYAVTQRRSSPT